MLHFRLQNKNPPLFGKANAAPNWNSIAVIIICCQHCHFLCHFAARHTSVSGLEFRIFGRTRFPEDDGSRQKEFPNLSLRCHCYLKHHKGVRRHKSRLKRWRGKYQIQIWFHPHLREFPSLILHTAINFPENCWNTFHYLQVVKIRVCSLHPPSLSQLKYAWIFFRSHP